MYRHVFWDLGGTLVDTYPALDQAFVDVVRDHGSEVSPTDVARLTRRSTGEAIKALSQRFGVAGAEFEHANDELKKLWQSSPPPPVAGAQELLRDVSAAGGLNLVVTHRERQSAAGLLTSLGLVVDDLVSTSDGYPRKPDPAMYRTLLERHGLRPEDCLAVGDRPIDAASAMAAGLTAATLESLEAPVDDEAKYSVERLDALRPLLGL